MIYLFIPLIIGFLISLIFTPIWIKKAREIGLLWKDMNKNSEKKVAGSGGIIVVFSFVVSILILIGYQTFIQENNFFMIEIFAMISVILIVSIIGFIDDIFGWQRGGLPMKTRLILVFLASIPLMVINAGRSEMAIPFLGAIDLGILYPLIIIPLGVVGATTTYNMLAGYNGLEAGQGILLSVALSIVSFLTGNPLLTIICLSMAAALCGFFIYNSYPSKVFPGDVLTYAVGSLIATVAILGNFEKIAVFFFIPYIIETLLKSRGKLRKHSFGTPNSEGYLEMPYRKIYSLNHLSLWLLIKMGIKPSERNATYLIWIFQLIIIIIGFIIFGEGLGI